MIFVIQQQQQQRDTREKTFVFFPSKQTHTLKKPYTGETLFILSIGNCNTHTHTKTRRKLDREEEEKKSRNNRSNQIRFDSMKRVVANYEILYIHKHTPQDLLFESNFFFFGFSILFR